MVVYLATCHRHIVGVVNYWCKDKIYFWSPQTPVLILIQSVDGGYDQSKNWKVGASDLSKTERSEPPTSQFPRGRPLLAHNSETTTQNHIKECVPKLMGPGLVPAL